MKILSAILVGLMFISIHLTAATVTSNAVTGNWNSASTWVGGVVPSSSDSVVIVNGATITLNVNATVYKLKINTGGTLSLSSFTLTLNGNGGLGGNLEIYGTLNGNSGIIQLTGDFTLSGTFNYATSTVVFNGNDAQRMLGNAPTFYHLRSTNTNNTVGKGVSLHQTNTTIKGNFIADGVFSRNSQSFPNATVTFDGVDTLKGSYSFYLNHVVINSGASLNGGYKTVYLYGNWTSNGSFICGNSSIVVKYDTYSSCQPNNQTIYVANPATNPFWNVTCDKTSGKVLPIGGTDNTLGHIYVLNNFSVNNGTWEVNDTRQLYVGKDFTCSGTGTFTAGPGRVIMNGSNTTTLQLLSPGNNSLYKLTINNSGAGVKLGSNTTVTYELNLTNGILYTRNGLNAYELYLSNNDISTSLTAYSSTSYVAGTLKRAVTNATYIFPVGVSNSILKKYRPITLNLTNTSGTTWILINEDSISNVGTYYASFWIKIQPDAGNPVGTVQFNYNLSQDFASGMQECMISALRGTLPPNPSWNYVLTTTTPASGANNGTISATLPAVFSPYAYILGEPTPQATNPTICDGNTATINITSPTGYGNFYWYAASTGGSSFNTGSSYTTPALTDTTTYYVAFFNPQCTGHRYPATVNVNDIPSSSFQVSNPVCSGNNGTISYSGTPISGATYTWNFGGATATPGTGEGPHTISGTAGNSYNVSLQVSANGCTSTQTTQTITFPTILNASITKTDAACGNNNGSATVTISGGVNPYSVIWSNNMTTTTISNLAAGSYSVTVTDQFGCSQVQSTTISNIGAPSVIVNVFNNVSCYGLHNGKAAFTATGSGTLNYIWSNGVSGSNTNNVVSVIDTLSAGTYFITVTDQNSCQTVEFITITQPDVLNPAYLSNNITCYGLNNGSISMQVTGGTPNYSYYWAHGSSQPNQTLLHAGIYEVTVTDAHNCTATQQITISQPDSIQISAVVVDITCFGENDGIIQTSVVGGTQPYTFQWSNGGNTATIDSLSSGTYVLNLVDANGCGSGFSAVVTQPQPVNIQIQSFPVTCYGYNDGSILTSVGGGTQPYTYIWNNGNTNSNLMTSGAGSYEVTITDDHGCTAVASETITEPLPLIVTLSSNSVTCNGYNNGSVNANIQGGVSPYSLMWNNGSSSNPLQNIPGGNYSVTITDANTCSVVQSVTVSEPSALMANYNITHISCNGQQNGSVVLMVSGGTTPYLFNWSNQSQSQNIYNLAPGSYQVTITDDNNCSLTQSYVIQEPSLMVINSTYSPYLCDYSHDGYIQLSISGGTPAYSYQWNNSAVNAPTQSNLSGGTYIVTVTDANLCQIMDTFNIVSSSIASVSIMYDPMTHLASTEIDGGIAPYSYLWSNQATDSTIYISQSGHYIVTITDNAGCTATAESDINAEFKIPTLITPNGDNKNDRFEIKGIEAYSHVSVEIFNRWGNKLFSFDGSGLDYYNSDNQWDGTYNGKELPMGSYLFIVNLFNGEDAITGSVSILR
ncbi:MAG TPA: gliding motility-associated C-terminal domain-containing protein [Bacteroidales bacterium]|nr:gliding motility-associated C-terminal domain-containing protein [Bacteroidales bacterium]